MNLAIALQTVQVESLICTSCGGIFPYVQEVEENGDIRWCKPLRRKDPAGDFTFLGHAFAKIEQHLGLEQYLDKYGMLDREAGTTLREYESFEDWTLRLGDKLLLCCPEDGAAREKDQKSISVLVVLFQPKNFARAGPSLSASPRARRRKNFGLRRLRNPGLSRMLQRSPRSKASSAQPCQ